MCLSRNSIASHRNYSKTNPYFVLAEIQFHLIKVVLRHFRIVPSPKVNCILSKFFYASSILRLSQNSISSHRSCSKTFPNCVLGETQLHLIENILRQFQNMSEPKFNCISSKFFYASSILRLSRNSSASHRTYCMTIPNCVIALIQMHLIENFLGQFQFVSEPKFSCISSQKF